MNFDFKYPEFLLTDYRFTSLESIDEKILMLHKAQRILLEYIQIYKGDQLKAYIKDYDINQSAKRFILIDLMQTIEGESYLFPERYNQDLMQAIVDIKDSDDITNDINKSQEYILSELHFYRELYITTFIKIFNKMEELENEKLKISEINIRTNANTTFNISDNHSYELKVVFRNQDFSIVRLKGKDYFPSATQRMCLNKIIEDFNDGSVFEGQKIVKSLGISTNFSAIFKNQQDTILIDELLLSKKQNKNIKKNYYKLNPQYFSKNFLKHFKKFKNM